MGQREERPLRRSRRTREELARDDALRSGRSTRSDARGDAWHRRVGRWLASRNRIGGARAYVAQRQALQGKESPAGSGKYPEPKWLGMIQHDMMMFDHGMPRADSSLSKEIVELAQAIDTTFAP